AIALFGDRSQFLPPARAFLARDQTQITRHLLAATKTTDVTESQRERQRRVRTDSRLRHQQLRLWMFFRRLLYRLIQLPDLLVEHAEQSQQVFPTTRRPGF